MLTLTNTGTKRTGKSNNIQRTKKKQKEKRYHPLLKAMCIQSRPNLDIVPVVILLTTQMMYEGWQPYHLKNIVVVPNFFFSHFYWFSAVNETHRHLVAANEFCYSIQCIRFLFRIKNCTLYLIVSKQKSFSQKYRKIKTHTFFVSTIYCM